MLQLIIARLVEDTERLLQAGIANLADFDIVVNNVALATWSYSVIGKRSRITIDQWAISTCGASAAGVDF